MTGSKDDTDSELHVVILGPVQKHLMFKKLCAAADRFEKHVHYNDVHYLYMRQEEKERVLEFTDPGLAHTGNREMAIRKCDVALIYCCAGSAVAFQQLESLVPDFEARKSVPVHFVFDCDDVSIDDEDGSSTGISSVSEEHRTTSLGTDSPDSGFAEGYESDQEDTHRLKRRGSMEKIREINEDGVITLEQVNELAKKFGDDCPVDTISSKNWEQARILLEAILSDVANHKPKSAQRRRILPLIRSKSKDSKSRNNSIEKKNKIEDSNNTKGSQKDSKVCVIM